MEANDLKAVFTRITKEYVVIFGVVFVYHSLQSFFFCLSLSLSHAHTPRDYTMQHYSRSNCGWVYADLFFACVRWDDEICSRLENDLDDSKISRTSALGAQTNLISVLLMVSPHYECMGVWVCVYGCMVYGVWSTVYGVWCMVYGCMGVWLYHRDDIMSVWVYGCMGVWVYVCLGVWVYGCLVFGVWCMWCMGVWCMVYGVWCMVYGFMALTLNSIQLELGLFSPFLVDIKTRANWVVESVHALLSWPNDCRVHFGCDSEERLRERTADRHFGAPGGTHADRVRRILFAQPFAEIFSIGQCV
jgi:hypothetical protein